MATPKTDYRALNQELETILSNLQAGDLDVDEAMKQYERGLQLIQMLEKYLTEAENKVTKLTKAASQD